MLNFSKINIFLIYLILIIISFFSLLNLQTENKTFINKKVNLGLDLQGGSYLLLEINSDPLVKERIQAKVIPIKKFLKENKLDYSNFVVNDKSLIFNIDNPEKFELIFFSKEENLVNPYIGQYNSFELDLKNLEKNKLEI